MRLGQLDGDLAGRGLIVGVFTLAVGATGKRRHKAKDGRGKERRQGSLVKLTDDYKLEFDFGDKPEEAEQPVDPAALEEIGVCPKCGGRVLVSPNAYVCEHTMGDKKCDFRISRTILQQEVNPEQVRLILTQGKSGLMTDFVSARTKRKFKAFLVWDAKSKKLGFEFPPREEGTKSATSKTTPRKKVS